MKRFAAISCTDDEKWGRSEGVIQRYEEFYRGKDVEWTGFHATRGHVPTNEDIENVDAFIISGSISSANDDVEWINKMKEFIRGVASRDQARRQPKLVGICFGHQLIGSALGGKVGVNPSREFVLQAEEIVGNIAASKVKGLEGLFDKGQLRLLQSHGECLTALPDGAITLASSATCKQEMVQFANNIIGLQAHPEIFRDEVEKLILPGISKKFNWSQEKINRMEATFKKEVHAERMNQAIRSFMNT